MRKSSMTALAFIFAVAYCGGGPSDGDVKEATEGIKSVYEGFFQVLEENKADPDQAIAEGEKYIESNKDKLRAHGKVLGGGVSAAQYEMISEFQNEVQTMALEANGRLRGSFGGNPAAVQKLGQLMDKLGNYYVAGAQEAEGAVPAGTGDGGRAAAKKVMIETAKQTASSIPDSLRDQMLDQWSQSIVAQGADDAEVKAFRDELKSELGW